ncbi:MAG: Re/Si-specific NAD(P)(+) transhydrogenase subunit alpha [Thermoanaerobaculum sp.]|nr:Re/Si-specific NAD(P)(+) transhydrogenase subunit alpha [Thermoanaerobaculum sp.]MCX7895202.1 Re/Si-specific NAD(P)(+) transhydrogenase subunit alpha [Thermoanaerobaculum sp.]MDW7967050.1 Re/Si-specific NAD(P)(+) transhydrogenase subunit alpha [Thermoanaerobaculum sp.]
MKIGVPRETRPGERRVALVADAVKKLVAAGHELLVERGAGLTAGVTDEDYAQAGAKLVSRDEVWAADLVVKVDRPTDDEVAKLRQGQVLVAMLQHLAYPDVAEKLASQGVTAFAMDWMPRITRAQDMDARSSMTTVQGYKAVLAAADLLPRFMPMLMTAAGTISPAHVLIIGAGVAGLQAIATAKRLGAVVEAFDVRPATKEQVESLGARFVAMDLQLERAQDEQGYAVAVGDEVLELERQTLAKRLPHMDAVISTALVPGQRPPVLLTAAMVESMRPGSVIVDLAAAFGGNCELTRAGEVVEHQGVKIVGYTDWESRLAVHASQMYSKNVLNYLNFLLKGGQLNLNLEDELVSFPLITHAGEVRGRKGGQ